MIPVPHGGRLIDRRLSPGDRARREAESKDLLKITPFIDEVYDAQQIGIGGYSPLDGFQDRGTLESILTTGRLPNGLPWSIPILLTPVGAANQKVVEQARPGDDIGLVDASGALFALLHLEE